MVRRTVDEAALLDMATDMKRFCEVMVARLDTVADELRTLDQTWGGVAFDAFLERLTYWQGWAQETGEQVAAMHRNAANAYQNYTDNNEVNVAMWGG